MFTSLNRMEDFLQYLPKIELHAHLSGSLSKSTLQELCLLLYGKKSPRLMEMCNTVTNFKNLHECFQKFNYIHQLTDNDKGIQTATELVIRDFSKDNVIYLELRTTPKCNNHMKRIEYVENVIKSIQHSQNVYNVIVKLLISIDRSQPYTVAEEIINIAIDMKHKYPQILKGIDLSGNPMQGSVKDFLPLLQKAKDNDLQLALHCAEIKNVTEADQLLQFGFQRLGHGTFLTDEQLQQCFKKNITIECCLTSNVKCGTVSCFANHHFHKLLLNSECKVVLCTDDSGIFDTNLTQEFLNAHKYYNLNHNDIYRLCMHAIEASFADDNEKSLLKERVDKYFTDKTSIFST